MSVIGSMYTGISGLSTHAQRMSVLGNNLANTSTVGFKSGSVQFEDLFYSSRSLGASIGQVGHGSRVASIYQDFGQGAFENTNSATDVAVGGNGFFMVKDPQKGSEYYTRAGNFNFNENGYLTDPNGMRVQGWDAVEGTNGVPQSTGALGDLKLDSFQSPPKETTKVELSFNLSKTATNGSAATTTPTDPDNLFAMFSTWDGTAATPIGDSKYAYQSTLNVYDESGSAHELTVYFDPVKDENGKQTWEYIVTCNPDEDGRTGFKGTSKAGLLMTGTMQFNSAGALEDMSAYTYQSDAAVSEPSVLADPGYVGNNANWSPAEFDANGFPVFTANFTNLANAGANGVNDTNDVDATGAQPEVIALDFGMSSKNTAYTNSAAADTIASVIAGTSNLAGIDPADVTKTNKAATAYDLASTTHSQSQDGYTAGFLQEITIDRNGCVYGRYSNGRKEELFILGLADFTNKQGLTLQGGNLYSKSNTSGDAIIGTANTGRLGSVASNTLELSNVDVSRQMVKLITTQRGYQSNSKVITTSDEMLQEAINLKR